MPLRVLGPTPADAVEQLKPLVALGVTHFMIYPHSFRTLERFCQEVPAELGRLGGPGANPGALRAGTILL
jgi:hypothetical protein